MAKDGDGKDKESANRQGSVVSEDEALLKWLNQLWATNEFPERVELYQVFGRNKNDRGERIFHRDFKPEKLNIEEVNHLVNDIMEAAQNDCDSLHAVRNMPAWYQVAVVDKNRKAGPVCRRIGPLRPQRAYVSVGDDDDENADAPRTVQALELEHIREGLSQDRWNKSRYDRVMGEMIMLQSNMILEQRQQNQILFDRQMAMFTAMQEAEDRRLDRDVVREKEKFKLGLYKEGIRTARNLLPGLFQAAKEGNEESQALVPTNGKNGHDANGQANGQAKKIDYGPSPERTLVDNFFSDIEDDEQLMAALFGEFDDDNVQTKPGVFTFEQMRTFALVRNGQYPASKLDDLMPQSGHALEITQEQIVRASDAGVTEGMGLAIVEILALRNKAKEKAAAMAAGNQPAAADASAEKE